MDHERQALIQRKLAEARNIVVEAYEKFPARKMALAWTGGKDSTLVLWLWRQVAAELGQAMPMVFCIDEYDSFSEVHEFIERTAGAWGLNVETLINQEVVDAAGGELGATVRVADLGRRNQDELARLGREKDSFAFEAESYVGNHLMKTVPFNVFIEDKQVLAAVQGLRWDEHPSRAEEEYFSYREAGPLAPAHWRINPILHLSERDVWNITLGRGVPYCPLYAQGYRSLGAKSTSQRLGEVPAWQQDLEHTSERGGRRQDKEAAMAKLRSLGYM